MDMGGQKATILRQAEDAVVVRSDLELQNSRVPQAANADMYFYMLGMDAVLTSGISTHM